MDTEYREIEATPSSTGGRDGGKIHRLYATPPKGAARFELLQAGWRAVDLTTGHYANTTLLREALALSPTGAGLVYAQI